MLEISLPNLTRKQSTYLKGNTMRQFSFCVLALSLLLVACGGDDVTITPDSRPVDRSDAAVFDASLDCIMDPAYADLTLGVTATPD